MLEARPVRQILAQLPGSLGCRTGLEFAVDDPAVIARPLSFTIVVTNNGPSPADGVVITGWLLITRVSSITATASQPAGFRRTDFRGEDGVVMLVPYPLSLSWPRDAPGWSLAACHVQPKRSHSK